MTSARKISSFGSARLLWLVLTPVPALGSDPDTDRAKARCGEVAIFVDTTRGTMSAGYGDGSSARRVFERGQFS